ncbi:MAG: hypothetical protein PF485_09285 [Bacteroidales bacterium]|jgi:hypothetical protein|nr:hypothetical protein [Bacteroidales bacterium]
MKKRVLYILIGAVITTVAFQSCEEEENETKISSYESSESHKAGQDCMECHLSGGDGEGWFKVAGTVYDEAQTSVYPNSTVKLYTGANATGDLVATVEVDMNGNFYTTKVIDFGSGLYTSVEGNTATKNMMSSITNGKCNSCHGVSTDRIWAK